MDKFEFIWDIMLSSQYIVYEKLWTVTKTSHKKSLGQSLGKEGNSGRQFISYRMVTLDLYVSF